MFVSCGSMPNLSSFRLGQQHNKCRHGDAHYIAPSAPFHERACCKRYAERNFAIDGK